MKKLITLLFLILLTLGLLIGYLFLTEKIIAGNLKVAEGQKQLEEGEKMLASGKARLARGESRLSRVKGTFNQFKSLTWAATAMPIAGGIAVLATDQIAKQKIKEGQQLVTQGRGKIQMGENQLAAGKLELSHGIKRLDEVNKIRIACGIGTAFFTALFIVLGFSWRKDISKFLKRAKA